MSVGYIIIIIVAAVLVLLLMVLRFKISAFIALLITSILTGILAGMPLSDIIETMQKGMGGTLGFVATVVGLGAIFGQMLESSGGAKALAQTLMQRFGVKKAPRAMVITGFIIAIPVFFDVGLVILAPILYALARDTKKSLLYFGIPLLAGLAVTHSFIPPTPGPVAVAEIVGADLGWVILFGFLLGIPTAIIAGPLFGKYISGKIKLSPPEHLFSTESTDDPGEQLPSFYTIVSIIALPLLLILSSTLTETLIKTGSLSDNLATEIIIFLGHPFTALILATLAAIWFLCLRRGFSKEKVLELSTRALGPAGIIILITGAGGVLKQVLVDSGIGEIMANSLAGSSVHPIVLAWLLSAAVRITQGSSTVAMITAAGIFASMLEVFELSPPQLALVVIAIASGATILSHVNDSGFWLVSKYFGMNEKQTLRSWTVMETIIAVCGLVFTLAVSMLISVCP